MTTRSWKAQSKYGWRTSAKVSRRKDCYEKQWLRHGRGDELGEDTNIDESGEETDIDERMAQISEIDAQQQAAWASELRGGEYASYVLNNHLDIIMKTSVRVQASRCSGSMI